MEGLHKRGGTRGKRGITQEKVSTGIERGKSYKKERSPLILIIRLCAFVIVVLALEHASYLASLQHYLVH